MSTTQKPWPSDAVMIVAANLGEEKRECMDSVVAGTCRDCGCPLGVDSWTIARAQALPSRHGRPVLYFCVACATLYDFNSINVFEDHRGRLPDNAGGSS